MQEHHKDYPCEDVSIGEIVTTDDDSPENSIVTYSTGTNTTNNACKSGKPERSSK